MSYTASDYNRYFDLGYNNANSMQAPGVNVFEKSLFLTKAYRQLVKEHAEKFEYDEQVRKRLEPSIKDKTINYDASLNSTLNSLKISSNSRLFEITDAEVWYVVQERLYTTDTKSIKVSPLKLDEYNEAIENPFEKPNNKKAWRVTVSDGISDTPKAIHEIISTVTPTKYKFRYLEKPEPIIIGDLSVFGVNIEGDTDVSIPYVSSEFEDAIIDRAVKLATIAYKENSLQAQMAVGDRDS